MRLSPSIWSLALLLAGSGACKSPSKKQDRARSAQSKQAEPASAKRYWKPARILAGKGLVQDAPSLDDGPSRWKPEFEGQDARQALLSLPYIAVQDAAGRVYIADKAAHAIRMVDTIQEIHTLAGTGQSANGGDKPQAARSCGLSYPNALWASPEGRVYVLDLGNAKVRKIDPKGTISTVFTLPKGLSGGRGLVLSADEQNIYVAGKDRIYHYAAGKGLSVLATGFVNLAHLAMAGPGLLWAADRDANLVYQVDAKGNKKVVVGNGTVARKPGKVKATEQGLDMPRALALLPGQGLLIGTQGGRAVYLLDKEHHLQLLLDGKNPGQSRSGSLGLAIERPLAKLRGLSVAPNGDLLLTHGDQGEVLRFEKNSG